MLLGKKIEIRPTRKQLEHLAQHAGTARWAYNWGLSKCKEAYQEWVSLGKPKKWKGWLNAISLHKELNLLKKLPIEQGGVSWMYQVSKCSPQEALRDLDKAFKGFLQGRTSYPKFKSRNKSQSKFRLTGTIKVLGSHIQLPSLGKIRIQPNDRGYIPQGKYGTASISERGGKWFVSIFIEEETAISTKGEIVGIDLGVERLATLSNGVVVENINKAERTKKVVRKVKKLQKSLSRKQKGSKNRAKTREKLRKAHYRLSSIREDHLHKASTNITKNHSVIMLENLNVKNMVKKGGSRKRGLNRVMHQASLGEFIRMLEYKAQRYGSNIIFVHPAYTSQTCLGCGHVSRENRKTQSKFECVSCGYSANADDNASSNILVKGLNACNIDFEKVEASTSYTLNACGELVRLKNSKNSMQGSLKQEHTSSCGFSFAREKSSIVKIS